MRHAGRAAPNKTPKTDGFAARLALAFGRRELNGACSLPGTCRWHDASDAVERADGQREEDRAADRAIFAHQQRRLDDHEERLSRLESASA